MIDQPHEPVEAEANNKQKPSGGPGQSKLVIPAYFDEQQHGNMDQTLRVKPRQITQTQRFTPRTSAHPSTNSSTRLPSSWSKDPARKVLIIATIALILSAIIFIGLASTLFLQNSNVLTQDNTASQDASSNVSGTVDLHPAFPTPNGGSGGSTSSQPSAYPTPTLDSNLPADGLQTPISGPLTVQIMEIPFVVSNGSTVSVGVITNEPGVEVTIDVRYRPSGRNYQSEPRLTSSNGYATLPWRVQVHQDGFGMTTATVNAVATDQNGQRAVSAPRTIQIF